MIFPPSRVHRILSFSTPDIPPLLSCPIFQFSPLSGAFLLYDTQMRAQGILLDLEGVLYQDNTPISGAFEALEKLHGAGLAIRYLTNTTTRCRLRIVERMSRMGFGVNEREVFTPAIAARRYLESGGLSSVYLATEPDLSEDFQGIAQDDHAPDAIIMGDVHTRFDWDLLDHLFSMVFSGARLIALHKNRYSRRDGRIALDLGPFVAAIEYAAGVEAIVMGKPAIGFFQMALQDMGLESENVIMVGDDPFSDIGGANGAGIRSVQVKTGKYKPFAPGEAPEPDALIDSISDLPTLLGVAAP